MNKYKEIEDVLRGYKGLKAQIRDIDLQLEQLDSLERIGMSAIDYSKDKLCPTFKFSSQTENEAIEFASVAIILKSRKIHAESLIKRIDNALESLGEEEKKVIETKYINDAGNKRAWYSLMGVLKASETTCWRIGQVALEKIESILYKDEII